MRLRDRERAKRKHETRATSTAVRRMGIRQLRRENEELAGVIKIAARVRPKTRAECIDGPRPCPWVGCRHHLFLDVNPKNGTIKFNFPSLEPDELDGKLESCSLDVAEDGTVSAERVGELMNVTRERVRAMMNGAQVDGEHMPGILDKVRLPLLRSLGPEVAHRSGIPRPPRADDDLTAEERSERGRLMAERGRQPQ